MPFHNQTQNSEISKGNQPKNKINIFVRKKTNINEKKYIYIIYATQNVGVYDF